jgi:hypothetical protein
VWRYYEDIAAGVDMPLRWNIAKVVLGRAASIDPLRSVLPHFGRVHTLSLWEAEHSWTKESSPCPTGPAEASTSIVGGFGL